MNYVIVVYGEDMVKQVIGPFNKGLSEDNSDSASYMANMVREDEQIWCDVFPVNTPERSEARN